MFCIIVIVWINFKCFVRNHLITIYIFVYSCLCPYVWMFMTELNPDSRVLVMLMCILLTRDHTAVSTLIHIICPQVKAKGNKNSFPCWVPFFISESFLGNWSSAHYLLLPRKRFPSAPLQVSDCICSSNLAAVSLSHDPLHRQGSRLL